MKEGFTATLVEDASRPLDSVGFILIKKELTDLGVHIIRANEILDT